MIKRVLFPVVALLLSALIVALGWQNRQLRQINQQMASQLQDMRLETHGLALGSLAAPLALATTQQARVQIGGPRATPQILYFFSTACRYCLASMPHVRKIAAARGASELIGVGLPPYDELAGYAGTHDLRFPIAIDSGGDASKRYRATVTPMLIVLGNDGSVAYKHVGQLDEQVVQAAMTSLAPDLALP
ncbi:TPA: peroxiredoxin family protein [Stenotrophomonas maltophilia]|uniref:TlpA disulfide reductase family protein n=1 Tax=Stenotrophomonas maltophilia TaxID=40324 RepID=A0AAJ2JC95_STEMA|nr:MULTISPECIES: TlpA disulfide reductase family protein [Stenotrophomonas]MBH1363229.1 TlpA family protein disulfide reductase [Stenotrophomonas maltophilia]MDQ7279561.1 TlpA disulfide reductase family protein [Stenotrophomonas sp. Sm6012]MDT3469016.1 TlpA disulfide reductase family protein [Stenotrophomonas maltophilia]HDS1123029.1 TlpA family protein disulfide reductase [Stenotrophomonas maltophilia]HEL3178124.1 TlpA family protein disulfide reductase [Stenotrophomonas maltophilia]